MLPRSLAGGAATASSWGGTSASRTSSGPRSRSWLSLDPSVVGGGLAAYWAERAIQNTWKRLVVTLSAHRFAVVMVACFGAPPIFVVRFLEGEAGPARADAVQAREYPCSRLSRPDGSRWCDSRAVVATVDLDDGIVALSCGGSSIPDMPQSLVGEIRPPHRPRLESGHFLQEIGCLGDVER